MCQIHPANMFGNIVLQLYFGITFELLHYLKQDILSKKANGEIYNLR